MILFVKTLDSCLRRNDTIKKSTSLTICAQVLSHMCTNDFYVTLINFFFAVMTAFIYNYYGCNLK